MKKIYEELKFDILYFNDDVIRTSIEDDMDNLMYDDSDWDQTVSELFNAVFYETFSGRI